MVLLSALPCNDEIDARGYATQNISKVEQKKAQETESCSPICLCSCCGQNVVEPQVAIFEIEIPSIEIEKQLADYRFSLLQQSHHIWQPPKLAHLV